MADKRVLVYEEDSSWQSVFAGGLKECGCDVVLCANLEEATGEVRGGLYGLAVVSACLSSQARRQRGLEVAQLSKETHPNTPIILAYCCGSNIPEYVDSIFGKQNVNLDGFKQEVRRLIGS